MAVAVSIAHLGLAYGQIWPLRDVSLEVRPGEVLGILGPSGSGKTTLLHLISGVRSPTEGNICLAGVDITRVPIHERNIGVVFQGYALFPHMTVFENVAFPLRMPARRLGGRAIRQKVKEVLDLVGLSGFDERRQQQLSGGQQQRVALARALVFEPELLLLDEPLAALDRNLREQMQREIRKIQQQLGTTVLYVTHDQSEAMTVSDRIAVLNCGRLIQCGSAIELYSHPKTAFLARFLGRANLAPGIVSTSDGTSVEVKLGSVTVRCAANGRVAPLDRVEIMVRPEHLRIGEGDTAGDGNVIPAEIIDWMFLGDSTKVIVAVLDGNEWEVRCPPNIDSNVLNSEIPVSVSWRTSDARVLVITDDLVAPTS